MFVNLCGDERPEYIVVASAFVAKHAAASKAKTGSVWYEFQKNKISTRKTEGWELFGR